MKVRIRCKRASARRYQKNRIRLMYALRHPRISLAHLDVSDLSCMMYSPYRQSRINMFGSHFAHESIPKE